MNTIIPKMKNNKIEEPVNEEVAKKQPSTETIQNVEFDVRVKVPNLNIRKGPGLKYETVKTGFLAKGIHTIVDVKKTDDSKKGFGKLKGSLGWISLDFVEKI